jgi:hypothetical protein
MTQQEQEMLQGLIQRVNQTKLQEKDLDAEEMLQQTLGRNPDALYILAQTVLVQQYALDQATQQLEQLRQQPRRATSFLGGLLGRDQPAPPPPPPAYAQPQPPPPAYAQPQYAPAPGYTTDYSPGYGAPQQGGFLRGAMQTAAGVAAGALAFEGIESLMHGFDHSAGYGSGFGGFGDSERPEVINNYYGDSAQHEHSGNLSPDIEDRRGESRFSQAVDDGDHGDSLMNNDSNGGDQDSFADGSSFDDSSDFSSDFDSGGGDDSSF